MDANRAGQADNHGQHPYEAHRSPANDTLVTRA
jgi:hypothetical protein